MKQLMPTKCLQRPEEASPGPKCYRTEFECIVMAPLEPMLEMWSGKWQLAGWESLERHSSLALASAFEVQ